MLEMLKGKYPKQALFRAMLIATLSLILTGPLFASKTWYVLSSTPDGNGEIFVRDDITITVNGNTIVSDTDGESTHLSPITLYLDKGDTIDITVSDSSYTGAKVDESTERPKVKHKRYLSPLYLVDKAKGKVLPVFAGLPEMKSNWQGGGTYIIIHYTVGTPMKEFCLSSASGACIQASFNEDLSLFNVSSSSYSLNMTPDQNAGDSEFLLHVFLPVPQDESDYPTVSLEITNWRRSGGVSPLYLVAIPDGATYTLIPYEIHIEGNCNKIHMCQKTTVFSGSFEINSESLFMPNAGYGVSIQNPHQPTNTLLFSYRNFDGAPHFMYIYFLTPDNEFLFVDQDGYIVKNPVLFYFPPEDITYSIPFPDYGDQAKLFTVGTYQLVALSDDGKAQFSGTLEVDPDIGDLDDIQGMPPDLPVTSVGSEVKPLIPAETLISEAYKAGNLANAGSFSFDVIEDSGTYTVTCTVELPDGGSFKKGSLVRYQRENPDRGEITWAMIVECQKQGENGLEYVLLSSLKNELSAQVNISSSPAALINLNQTVTLTNDQGEETGEAYYNSIPWVLDTPTRLSFRYQLNTPDGSISYTSSTFSREIQPASGFTESPPGYTYGGKVSIKTTFLGDPVAYLLLAVNVVGVTSPVHKGQYKAKAYVDFDSDGETDAIYPMNEESPGVFRKTLSIPFPEDASSLTLAYFIEVTDSSGNELPGEVSRRVQTVTVPAPNGKHAVTISGDSEASLGNPIELDLSYASGEKEPLMLQPYVGLYKEGRGVLWLVDTLRGFYQTSAQESPLVPIISTQQCSPDSPCTATISVNLPSHEDLFSFLFPGKYSVIVLIKDFNGNVVASGVYPVRITP